MLDQDAPAGRRHFTSKLSQSMGLVTCPCAFRLRRLAQSGAPGHDMAIVTCAIAFRLRWLVQGVGPRLGIGPPPQHHHSEHHHLPPP